MHSMDGGENRAEVTFKLDDVLCPEQNVIMAHLGSGVEVVGRVQFLSDGGSRKKEFAIVEVPGISVPLVVPRDRLRVLRGRNAGEASPVKRRHHLRSKKAVKLTME